MRSRAVSPGGRENGNGSIEKGELKMAKKGFVSVTGYAVKVKNFRRETNGLVPFFEKPRITKEQEDNLAYLLEEGKMVQITIAEVEKTIGDMGDLFPDLQEPEPKEE
jgi:hypothetical protein